MKIIISQNIISDQQIKIRRNKILKSLISQSDIIYNCQKDFKQSRNPNNKKQLYLKWKNKYQKFYEKYKDQLEFDPILKEEAQIYLPQLYR